MHQVEVWLWVYPDPVTGERRTTRYPVTAVEAACWPGAVRVAGSMQRVDRLDPDEFFQETAASAFYQAPS